MRSNPPNSPSFSPGGDDAARKAADWVARMDRRLTPEERRELELWMTESPGNGAELARLQTVWGVLDRAAAVPALTALADAAEARAGASRARRTFWIRSAGVAAAAAIAALFAVQHWPAAIQREAVEAAPSGQCVIESSSAREIALPDNSVAAVNQDGLVVPEYLPEERRVKLARGEAHFHVAKDPSRPFIVSAGSITVRALGTAFDVRLEADSIQVLVTEGTVSLGSAAPIPMGGVLGSGDRAIVHLQRGMSTSVTVDRPPPAEADRELSWESTRLVFNRTPLAQVVTAFNRFNSTKMILADESLGNRTLSGTFRADNLTGFVRLLSASVDVVAVPDGDQQLVLKAAGGTRL